MSNTFVTPNELVVRLQETIEEMYPTGGPMAYYKGYLPDLDRLQNVLPQSECGGLNISGINHFGIHYPENGQSWVSRRTLGINTFTNAGQMMRMINVDLRMGRFASVRQINTCISFATIDGTNIWLELGLHNLSYVRHHIDFVIDPDSLDLFDIWFKQFLPNGRKKFGPNNTTFVENTSIPSPLPEYQVISNDRSLAWHFRTPKRNISQRDWPPCIGNIKVR